MSDNSNARFAAETGTGAQLRRLAGKSGPLIALVALCLILSVLSPYFATADNLTNVSRQVAFVALLAIGQTYVILTGGIDLSVAAVAALAASVTTVLMTQPLALAGVQIGPMNPVLDIVGAVFLLLGTAPAVLLVFAGGFNGLILPLGLTLFMYVGWMRRDLMGGYPYSRALLALGTLAWRNAWDPKELDTETKAALLEKDTAKRAAMYEDLQRKVMESGPFVMIYQQVEVAAFSAKLKGFRLGPSFDTNLVYSVSKE